MVIHLGRSNKNETKLIGGLLLHLILDDVLTT